MESRPTGAVGEKESLGGKEFKRSSGRPVPKRPEAPHVKLLQERILARVQMKKLVQPGGPLSWITIRLG